MAEPFRIEVPDEVLADLRRRLDAARLPNEIDGAGWDHGTDLGFLKRLISYWRDGFDWRAQERRLNLLDHRTAQIDGQRIHFIHVRSGRPDALPLMLVHGWPGSFVEYLDVIESLTAAGAAETAYDLIIPSLPGYGFWARPRSRAGIRAASRQRSSP